MSKYHVAAAQRHRKRVHDALTALTDDRIEQLNRQARHTTRPDGFPTSTLGDGGSRGTDPTTSVESAALRQDTPHPDPVGRSIRQIFEHLKVMSDAAATIGHLLGYIDNVHRSSEGRQPSLAGECEACNDVVSGAERDRLRSGLCRTCYEAMRSEAPTDRGDWLARRRSA